MLIRELKDEYIIEEMKGNNFGVIYQFNKELIIYKDNTNKIIENKFITYCNEDEKIYYVEVMEDILEDMEIKEIKTFKEINLEEAKNIKSKLSKYLLNEANENDKDVVFLVLDDYYRMRNLTMFEGNKKVKYSSLLNIEVSAKVNFLL
ncbi:MAG: hypothetical protein IJ086_13965 [Clostridium sp.]|nr:hypothetical protein [Clostridium sp.]MBQ9072678.1 hypothetical protein [Bacilli bacterium]